MSTMWHPDTDVTPTTGEVDMMAAVLEGRHGVHAETVAQFLTDWNAHNGDAPRSWAWAAVATKVRERMSDRVGGDALRR